MNQQKRLKIYKVNIDRREGHNYTATEDIKHTL